MSVQLKTELTPPDSTDAVTYESYAPDIVSVSDQGLVSGLAQGSADIIVRAGSQSAVCSVTVSAPEQVTITINPTPAEAQVKLNGSVQKSIEVLKGSEVTYEVSADGYKTKTETIFADQTKTVDVVLEADLVSFQITSTPPEATITINGAGENPVSVPRGSTVTYSVAAEGYETKSDSVQVDEDTNLQVTLSKVKVTITITPTPDDAQVKLNEVVQSSITVDYGTSVTYEVSKQGYVTKSETITATETKTIPITLEEDNVTFTITPTPPSATVKINQVAQSSITVKRGESVEYSVEKEGYETTTDTYQVNEDTTLPVTLTPKNFTITVNPTPSDATVILNSEERKSVTLAYGTVWAYTVSKQGYQTAKDNNTTLEDQTIDVVLKKYPVYNLEATFAPTTDGTQGSVNLKFVNQTPGDIGYSSVKVKVSTQVPDSGSLQLWTSEEAKVTNEGVLATMPLGASSESDLAISYQPTGVGSYQVTFSLEDESEVEIATVTSVLTVSGGEA